MSDALTELRERLAEIADLNAAGGLLGWDQQTMMPERAAPQRASSPARSARSSTSASPTTRSGGCSTRPRRSRARPTRRSCASRDATGRRRGACRASWPPSWRARGRSAIRRGSRRASARTSPRSCRRCARNVELKLRYVECFDGFEDPYDVLLDDYEEGMTSAEVDRALHRAARRAGAADRGHRHAGRRGRRRAAARRLPGRGSASWSAGCCGGSAGAQTAGGSTRLPTRSRRASARATCA